LRIKPVRPCGGGSHQPRLAVVKRIDQRHEAQDLIALIRPENRNVVEKHHIEALGDGQIVRRAKGLAAQYPRKNDMKYLLSWCRRVGGKDVQILSYLEIRLYGLQFYLDGNFKRLADETMAWSDARIFPFIRETLKKDRTHPYVILTRRRYGHYLEEKLIARKIKFQSYHDKFWELCLISPEAPP